MNTIQKTAIIGAVVVVGAGGMYYLGVNHADASLGKLLSESQSNQIIAEQQYGTQSIKDSMQHMVESIQIQQTLTLVEETGITTLKVSQHDTGWNKWLTSSSTDFAIEYKVLVGIDVSDITFIQEGDKLIVVFNDSSFKVQGLEIVNKNIIMKRAIFGQNLSEDEKIAIEKQIVAEVKDKVINDFETQSTCRESLQSYIFELAQAFNIENVEVIG
jgi:hypothetical protein